MHSTPSLSANRPLHILFLTPAYPPFHGGGERYVQALARALVAQGHRLTIITSTAATERDFWQPPAATGVTRQEGERLTIYRCPLRPLAGGRPALMAWRKAMVVVGQLPHTHRLLQRMAQYVPAVRQLPSTLEALSDPIDLVHGFNISWEYPLLAGWQWAGQRGLPVAVTPFAHLGHRHGDRVALNSTMPHQLRVLHTAAAVLVLTDIEKAGLMGYGVPERALHVIGGGLDPVPTEGLTATAVRQKFGLQRPFVLFVGRINYEKGAIHAAQAVLALQQRLAVELVLIGQQAADFQRFRQRLSPAERAVIRPLGSVSEHDKHSLLQTGELLVLPSRADSFGIVLLEAWAHHKPVIGARAGGIPGVIAHEQDGFLVDFGDVAALQTHIHTLLTNRPLHQKMGQAGHQKVAQQYQWSRVGERVYQQYRPLIDPS